MSTRLQGKYAERLTILNDSVGHLKARLYSTMKAMSSNTPWGDNKALDKLVKFIVNKYAEWPSASSVNGYDYLRRDAAQFIEQLRFAYDTMVDWAEHRTAIITLLREMSDTANILKFQTSPQVLVGFMNLFVAVIQMDTLAAAIPDRKVFTGLYALSHLETRNTNEPSFGQLSSVIGCLDDPYQALQEDIIFLGETVGDILNDIMMSVYRVTAPSSMRKDGNISLHMNDKSLNLLDPEDDSFAFELEYINDFFNWATWSYLVCPQLLSDANHMSMLKTALAEGFVFQVYRDMTVNLHSEYETVFSKYKTKELKLSSSSNKKILTECAVAAVTESGLNHKERRDLLRTEMHHTYSLLKRKPGLLGPKYPMVIASLAVSRHEIIWYMLHMEAQPPKVKGVKSFDEEQFFDAFISQLLHIHDAMTQLVIKYKHVVQKYYLEYLTLVDCPALIEHVETFKDDFTGTEADTFKRIQNTINSLSLSQLNDKREDFAELEGVQLNWKRLICGFVTTSKVSPLKIPKLVQAGLSTYRHAGYVYQTIEEMNVAGHLGDLVWFPEKLGVLVEDCLHSKHDDPMYVLSIARLADQFPLSGSVTVEGEKQDLGETAINFAEDTVAKICARVAAIVAQIAGNKGYIGLNMQLDPLQAATIQEIKYRRSQAKQDEKKKKKSSKGKDVLPQMPDEPGVESKFSQRHTEKIQNLTLYQQSLAMFCRSIRAMGKFNVWNVQINPTEFLREQIVFCVATFIIKAANTEGDIIQRPTVLERQIDAYLGVVKSVQSFMGMDVDSLVHVVFSGHFNLDAFKGTNEHLTNLKSFRSEGSEHEKSLVWIVSQWYINLVFDRIQKTGILFSDVSNGFVSTNLDSNFKAEEFCDLEELKALCRMMGPMGVRCMDYMFVKKITDMVDPIKDILANNEDNLASLVANFPFEPYTSEMLVAMQGMNELTALSIHVGCGLKFRKLLRQAIGETVEEYAPLIPGLLDVCMEQIEQTYKFNTTWSELACLAQDAGVSVKADPMLVYAWRQYNVDEEDNELWLYLPYIFAATFATQVWSESPYNTTLEAHENNAHVIAETISTLITTMIPMNKKSDNKLVKKTLKNFVEVSSIVLLRMTRQPPANLSSMFVFLDRFVKQNDILTHNYLENAFPYPLLRSTYTELYKEQLVLSEEELNAKPTLKGKGAAESSSSSSSSSSG